MLDNKSLSCLPAGSCSKRKKKRSSGSVIREFEGCGRAVCQPTGSSSIRVDRIWSMPIRSCGSCQHKQEQIAAKKTSWQSRLFFLQNAHMESGTDNT